MIINESILKFSEFLDSYKDKYAKPSSEISLPKPQDHEYKENKKLYPLVNTDYIMLDFDSICADANFFLKDSKEASAEVRYKIALIYMQKNNIRLYHKKKNLSSFF